ncbi:MAG: YifB family Mg chelatase-like AAA ATPase, partial [bacterium]
MLSKVQTCAIIGFNVEPIEVEVDFSTGFVGFNIVGLPDAAIKEAKERLIAAFKNSQISINQNKRLTVNLAPADIRKEGPAYDLPIAVGMMLASTGINFDTSDCLFIGELSLEGRLRHTNGILSAVIFAKENNIKKIFLPELNANEAALVGGMEIYPVKSISQLFSHVQGIELIETYKGKKLEEEIETENFDVDMAYVQGQEHVKRALEISASGAHNLLMSGPPGSGKTLLARTLPSIMPRLIEEEVLEITKIYSIAGLLPHNQPLIHKRPFRAPHHTSSGASLVGGGKFPRPGEISLAHRGVLFLDEFPEFPRQILDSLRQPLEDGIVTISRAQGTLTFPARFTLIAAQNPCPCGHFGNPQKQCICSPSQVSNYQKKISGPILDRIDLHVDVPSVKFEKLTSKQVAEKSEDIRKRVHLATRRQLERFKNKKINYNSEMGPNDIKEFCKIDTATSELLKNAMMQLRLSARSYHRILKLARTIADLAQEDDIKLEHVAEALQYRPKE